MKRLNFWQLVLLALAVFVGRVNAQADGAVKLAVFEGPVTPVLASYLDRAIADAEASGATALVLQLDTPGGSVDITKGITQRITSATLPISSSCSQDLALKPVLRSHDPGCVGQDVWRHVVGGLVEIFSRHPGGRVARSRIPR